MQENNILLVVSGSDRQIRGIMAGAWQVSTVSRMNQRGSFTVDVAAADPGAFALVTVPHPQIEVRTADNRTVFAGTLDRPRLTTAPDGTERIVASGIDDVGLFGDRIIANPQGSVLQVESHTGPPGAVAQTLLDAHAVNPTDTARVIDGTQFRVAQNGAGTVDREFQGENLLEAVEELLSPAGLALRVERVRDTNGVTLMVDILEPSSVGEFTVSQFTGSGGSIVLERTGPEATVLYGAGKPVADAPAARPVTVLEQPDAFWGRRIERLTDVRSTKPGEIGQKLADQMALLGSAESLSLEPDTEYGLAPRVGATIAIRTEIIGRIERQITRVDTQYTADLTTSQLLTGRPPETSPMPLAYLVDRIKKLRQQVDSLERR